MAQGNLVSIAQQDFAAGEVPAFAPHLMPANGAWKLRNMLLDDDGSAYKRGGTIYKSAAAFGAQGLRFLWDGYLAAGRRTVLASPTAFGVLDADDETVINLGGGGLTSPLRPAVFDGILFVGSRMYGGSRKTANYSTGTVAVTEGSDVVIGTGTAWAANLDAGMLLQVAGGQVYVVESVTDNTHVTLAKPWQGATAAGQAYVAAPTLAIATPYRGADIYIAAGGRLLACVGSRAFESAIGDASNWLDQDGLEVFHEVPGGQILGGEALREQVLLFTTEGVWVITNVSYDLVDDFGDVQQQLQPLSREIVLWSNEGVAAWQGGLIVPAVDGVWLVGLDEPPQLISRSITSRYVEYVTAGYKTGLATVHKSHYLLPILDSSDNVVDMLVCRLDRPVRTNRGVVWGWTHWRGSGANVVALATRIGSGARQPTLLGAERGAGSRVVQMADFAADGPSTDHDGTAFRWELISRDFPTGQLNRNLVKFVEARYELVDADVDNPVIEGFYATDDRAPGTEWGGFLWGETEWTDQEEAGFAPLAGDAPEDPGDTPHRWRPNRRVRFFRMRLRSEDPARRAVVRSLQLWVRPSARP